MNRIFHWKTETLKFKTQESESGFTCRALSDDFFLSLLALLLSAQNDPLVKIVQDYPFMNFNQIN